MKHQLDEAWVVTKVDFDDESAVLENVEDDIELRAKKLKDTWVVCYESIQGVPSYSCLAEFSTRVVVPDVCEVLDILLDAGTDEVGDDYVRRCILENGGQRRLFDNETERSEHGRDSRRSCAV